MRDPASRITFRRDTRPMMRRSAIPPLLTVALLLAAAGCQGTSANRPRPALEMVCDSPVPTDLGVPTVRRPARFTTSGGRHRFVVTALPSGSILGEVEDTEVLLGDPDAPDRTIVEVTVSLREPGVVDVEAGTYSVLNTNRGSIEVEVCHNVTLSGVEPATPTG